MMVKRKLQRTNTVLFFCFLVITGLYFGASVLIPIAFAIFFSTLMAPLSNFLERKAGASRITSSFISSLFLFVGVGLILFFLIRQFGMFFSDLLERKEEIRNYIGGLQERLMSATGFSLEQQEEMLKERLSEIISFLQRFLSSLFADITGGLGKFFLVVIYVFLLLINRSKFTEFVMMYIPEERQPESQEIINKIKTVAQKYLWGRIQVMFLLAVMYAIAFTAYGLEHAPLLILFGTIVTIVPYIGPLVSGILPVLFMIIFGGSSVEIISFTIIVIIIQLIESYVLEPVIIGSEVQQSPLFVILAVILGGAIWGAAGLILFVPIFGILKIIFDHNKELQPIGFLIGYKRPGEGESLLEKVKKRLRK